MIGAHLSVLCILIPFISAILCFLFARRLGSNIGILSAFILTAVTFLLGFQLSHSGSSGYAMGGWSAPLGINIHLNGFSVIMLIFTAVVGTCISLYASGYFKGRETSINDSTQQYAIMEIYFWPIWFFTWGGLNVLFLSADIFNIYVALEIVSFSAIALVALKGSKESLLAATRYFFLTLLGSLFYLLGVSLFYSAYGVLSFEILEKLVRPDMISSVAIVFMTMGLVIKTALFPMHFWLPSAHANSPAPVSAILSGLVVMGAFYLLVRFWLETFFVLITPAAGQLVGLLASVSILGGSWLAIRQERLKMMLAYSTVAQIGYMFLVFPLFTAHTIGQSFAWTGGIYFSISHACAKAAAFMVAGSIMYTLGHDRINDLRGLAQHYPIGVFAFALAGVSLMGLPPSGGFVGKWMLLKAAMLSGQWWYAVLIVIGSILSAWYIFQFLEAALSSPLEGKEKLHIPVQMTFSSLLMACIAIILGLVAVLPLEMLKIDSPVLFQSVEGFVK